jgi:hypothetical protein
VLSAAQYLSVYYNATANQNWGETGELFGRPTGRNVQIDARNSDWLGAYCVCAAAYVLVSSRPSVFKGATYDLARLPPNGFTFFTLSSNIPLDGTPALPRVFAAAGSGVAIEEN